MSAAGEMNNRRAQLGAAAVAASARGELIENDAATAISDALADIAHLCDLCGIDAEVMFERGLRSYEGDFEDGPKCRPLAAARRGEATLVEIGLAT